MDQKNESVITNNDNIQENTSEAIHNQDELTNLQSKVDELNDQLLRALAENQNLRRRLQTEVEAAHQYAISKLTMDLLPVADNFDRALELISDELRNDEKFKDFILGIELTEKELSKAFEVHHIQKHVPLNEKFDHHFHQALFDLPTEEEESGTIMQVLQPGYTLKDRLLRPSMVGVAKKQDKD